MANSFYSQFPDYRNPVEGFHWSKSDPSRQFPKSALYVVHGLFWGFELPIRRVRTGLGKGTRPLRRRSASCRYTCRRRCATSACAATGAAPRGRPPPTPMGPWGIAAPPGASNKVFKQLKTSHMRCFPQNTEVNSNATRWCA
eukprot:7659736-Pyramimonas_sp.AAC.1